MSPKSLAFEPARSFIGPSWPEDGAEYRDEEIGHEITDAVRLRIIPIYPNLLVGQKLGAGAIRKTTRSMLKAVRSAAAMHSGTVAQWPSLKKSVSQK